jgi:hypothetical protein
MTEAQPDTDIPGFTVPDHPDFDLLLDLATRLMDLPASSGEFDFEAHLGQEVDAKSAAYVALRRSMSYVGVTNPQELQQHLDLVMRSGMIWMDGLYLGIHFERERESALEPDEDDFEDPGVPTEGSES